MPVPPLRNVILAGGNLGPSILWALEQDSDFTVSILARETSTSTYPAHITVHRIKDTYPEEEVLQAFQGHDAVVSALSVSNVIVQLGLIDAAVKAGIKWFIPAEFGGNKEAAKNGVKIPLQDTKELVLEHLVKIEAKGLSWSAVATGPFIDWGLANGFLGFDLKARKVKIYDTGNVRWTGTTVSTIGLAVARLLRQLPEAAKNRFISIYSVSTTQNEILAAFESENGEKWTVDHVKMDAEIEAGQKLLASGNRSGIIPLILSYFFREGMGADYTQDVDAANELLSLPTESVVDIVGKLVSQ